MQAIYRITIRLLDTAGRIYIKNDESTLEGAAREAFEEAQVKATDLQLFGIYNLPRISQVYNMFRGVLENGHAAVSDSLSTGINFIAFYGNSPLRG